MSGAASGGSPQASLLIQDDIEEGASSHPRRRVVEYYDVETDSHRMWTALRHPAREGYAFPDDIVFSLEGERDFLRRREMELEGEVNCLQAEIRKLLGMVERLQEENSELRADRVRTCERLRKVTMDVRAQKLQLRKKDAYLDRGMLKI